MSIPENFPALTVGTSEEWDALRARVAEVERERDDWRVSAESRAELVHDGCDRETGLRRLVALTKADRDAALARVGVLEAALRDIDIASSMTDPDEAASRCGVLARRALAPRSERREGEPERSFWRCRMGHEHSTHGAAMNCDRYGIVESAPPAAPKEEE